MYAFLTKKMKKICIYGKKSVFLQRKTAKTKKMTVTKSASKQALLQEITKAGAQAMKIARGEKKGRNAYDLLNEL